jgi:Fe-S-cluster containining protein
MKEIMLSPQLSKEIGEIYGVMQEEYDPLAQEIGLTCQGCPDNCCDSYFFHYTYSEWAYLWQGIRRLDDQAIERVVTRAKEYIEQGAQSLAQGKHPQIMCPLHDNGLCSLYQHRMLVCRMHGIPAVLTRPDGQHMRFPGCFRCQDIVKEKYAEETDAPAMDRSLLFRRLAALESRLMSERRNTYPKIRKTIAEMIVQGPPTRTIARCEWNVQ